MTMVSMPRPRGQPISPSMATNSKSSDRPVITSGMTSGADTVPAKAVRPRKRRKRTSATAASVPRTSAMVAESAAICRLSQAAPSICGSRNNSPYHLVEKPDQTVTSRDSLNEKITSDTMGA